MINITKNSIIFFFWKHLSELLLQVWPELLDKARALKKRRKFNIKWAKLEKEGVPSFDSFNSKNSLVVLKEGLLEWSERQADVGKNLGMFGWEGGS